MKNLSESTIIARAGPASCTTATDHGFMERTVSDLLEDEVRAGLMRSPGLHAFDAHGTKKMGRGPLVFFGLIFPLFAAFVVWYVHHERYIYYWDFVGYQNIYIGLGYRFLTSPLRALHYVFVSIRESDYNSLPVLLLMPVRLVFGTGRLGYILGLTGAYVLPLLVLFPYTVSRLVRTPADRQACPLGLRAISFLILAAMPSLWSPVLLGYPDAGGLLLICAVLSIYFRTDLVQQNMANLISLGLLLGLMVLFRRWYAFWAIGFFGALAVCEGLQLIANKERRPQFSRLLRNALIVGEVSFLSVFIVATPIATRMVTTNYGDIYSAYRSKQPLLHNLKTVYSHFGLLTLLLAGLGLALSEWKPERRRVGRFLFVQLAVTYLVFTWTQDLGVQHFYSVLPTIAIFVAIFLQDVFLWTRGTLAKTAFLIAFLSLSIAGFVNSFLFPLSRWAAPVQAVLPQETLYPKVRTDLNSIRDLLGTLRQLANEPNEKIYILSSSLTLNSSIAQEACVLLNPPHRDLVSKLLPTNDVDKRDGFPVGLVDANYVVLTLPFGYHLAPKDQRVIGIPAEQIVRSEGIGASYDKLNYEFPLEDGSSAFIYKRARPLQLSDLRALSAIFLEFYPNHRDQFEIE